MKRTLEFLLVGLIAGGLLTGCPKKEEEAKTDEPETATQEEPETAAQEEDEEKPETAAQLDVDEENYQKALFEISCVKAKIDDTEQQKAIITEVHARYGFDEESYASASEAMKEKPDVQAVLSSKMEECTPELAAGFAKAGEDVEDGDEAEKEDEDKEKKPTKAAKKWKEGSYADGNVTGGGLSKASLKLRVTKEGKVLGSFQGTREGKGFSIPLKGEISKNGEFQARGNRGPNNARAVGRYGKSGLTGKLRGSINKKGLTVAFNAK